LCPGRNRIFDAAPKAAVIRLLERGADVNVVDAEVSATTVAVIADIVGAVVAAVVVDEHDKYNTMLLQCHCNLLLFLFSL
jgi:hypothetical protein